jgi:DNA-binding response OmpR family regulator
LPSTLRWWLKAPREGFQIYGLLDGTADILSIIDQCRPHVVMLDYRLHGKLCIDVLKKIKQKYPHLPVIAMSCNCKINEEYRINGFDDYIPKPFDLDELYSTLRKHIPNSKP